MSVAEHHGHVLKHGEEKLGVGLLPMPEYLLYDEELQVLYTGYADGWIKRIKLTGSASEAVVENWVHVDGWPLGLAFGPDKELIVAGGHGNSNKSYDFGLAITSKIHTIMVIFDTILDL